MRTHEFLFKGTDKVQQDHDGEKINILQIDGNEEIDFTKQYGALLIQRGEGYEKRTIEGLFNLFAKLTTQRLLSFNKKEYNSPLNEHGLNIEMISMIKSLGMFVGYFINTTSWEEQELKDFDKYELKNRLEKVLHYLK